MKNPEYVHICNQYREKYEQSESDYMNECLNLIANSFFSKNENYHRIKKHYEKSSSIQCWKWQKIEYSQVYTKQRSDYDIETDVQFQFNEFDELVS